MAVMLLVLGFCLAPVPALLAAPFPLFDEAALLVHAEQILAGRFPARDFYTVYGPGGPGALAAIFWLTGPSVIAERALGMAYHVGVALGVARLATPCGRAAGCAAGVLSALLMLPVGLAAYAWFGGLALASWSLSLLVTTSGRRATLAAGILGGLVAAWRVEMLVLLLAAGPLIWKERAKGYLTGIAVGLVPVLAYTLWAGPRALTEVLDRAAVDAQLEAIPSSVRVWLCVLLLATGALVVGAFRRSSRRTVFVAYALLAVVMLPQALQRIDMVHILYVLCVVGPLGVAMTLRIAGRRVNASAGKLRAFFGVAIALAVGTLTAIASASIGWALEPNTENLTFQGRTIPVVASQKPRLAAQLRMIARTIPTGSSVFVGAKDMSVPTYGDDEFYHLLPEYQAHSYYLQLPPDIAHRPDSPLLKDVLQTDALILTDVPRWQSRRLLPHVGGGSDAVNRAVATHFCARATVWPVTVYLRCDAK